MRLRNASSDNGLNPNSYAEPLLEAVVGARDGVEVEAEEVDMDVAARFDAEVDEGALEVDDMNVSHSSDTTGAGTVGRAAPRELARELAVDVL